MTFKSIRTGLVLLSFPVATALQAAPLGRLFFAPAERIPTNQKPVDTPPPSPPPRLDGIITRSAGAPTLFLDGQATIARPEQVRIEDASALVRGADGRRHRLRVGIPPPDAP
ncbi:hypothetical protein [Zoogloea sp.]|uniref:hypothetical protein n=1 Tax=Zoogloea sp. TaxID=49181 RepID=UPI0025E1F875|nr:hypothetical protein [Zoogloea sp.]MCK6392999.1 hypothetical protein [Zoogloea sp.]